MQNLDYTPNMMHMETSKLLRPKLGLYTYVGQLKRICAPIEMIRTAELLLQLTVWLMALQEGRHMGSTHSQQAQGFMLTTVRAINGHCVGVSSIAAEGKVMEQIHLETRKRGTKRGKLEHVYRAMWLLCMQLASLLASRDR